MIEGQGQAPVPGIEDDGPPGVVGAFGIARGPGQKDRRDRVEARVARWVRIGPQLADETDVERSLLAGLPHGGLFERLAVVHEAARQRPAGGRIAALDEDDAAAPRAVHNLDDDVDGRERIAVFAAGHGRRTFRGHCRFRLRGLSIRKCPRFSRPSSSPGDRRRSKAPTIRRSHWHKKCYYKVVNRSETGERS